MFLLFFFFILQLQVLYAVPDVDLISHLPEFLDGLFNIFKDRNPEIRKMLVHRDIIWQIPVDYHCLITPFIGDLTKAVAYMYRCRWRDMEQPQMTLFLALFSVWLCLISLIG